MLDSPPTLRPFPAVLFALPEDLPLPPFDPLEGELFPPPDGAEGELRPPPEDLDSAILVVLCSCVDILYEQRTGIGSGVAHADTCGQANQRKHVDC